MEQNNNEIEKNDGNEELSTFNSQLSTKNNIYPIFDRMLAREDKEDLLKQHSVMIWFTGLSGSGKSTIAPWWWTWAMSIWSPWAASSRWM